MYYSLTSQYLIIVRFISVSVSIDFPSDGAASAPASMAMPSFSWCRCDPSHSVMQQSIMQRR